MLSPQTSPMVEDLERLSINDISQLEGFNEAILSEFWNIF